VQRPRHRLESWVTSTSFNAKARGLEAHGRRQYVCRALPEYHKSLTVQVPRSSIRAATFFWRARQLPCISEIRSTTNPSLMCPKALKRLPRSIALHLRCSHRRWLPTQTEFLFSWSSVCRRAMQASCERQPIKRPSRHLGRWSTKQRRRTLKLARSLWLGGSIWVYGGGGLPLVEAH
jgi:hypothetical protein